MRFGDGIVKAHCMIWDVASEEAAQSKMSQPHATGLQ